MISHYFKIAFRNLSKNRQQTLISITGLVVGIVSFSLCTYMVRFMVEMNSEFPHYKRMAYTYFRNQEGGFMESNTEVGRTFSLTSVAGIETVGVGSRVEKEQFLFSISDDKEIHLIQKSMYINKGFTEVISAQWLFRSASLFINPHGVILSESTAKKIYGNSNPVGNTIQRLSASYPYQETTYTIYGVMKDLPVPNGFSPFEPVDIFICMDDDNTYYKTAIIYSLLSSSMSTEEINNQFRSNPISLSDTPEKSYYPVLRNDYEGKKGLVNLLVWGLMIVLSGVVLFAGMANFFFSCLNSIHTRTCELSLRKNLGSGVFEPFRHLFIEMLIVITLSFIVSIVTTELLVWTLSVEFINGQPFTIDTKRILFQQFQYFPFLLLICLILSLAASYRHNQINIVKGIKGGNKYRVRKVLTCLQFFFSILFLAISGTVQMQYLTIQHSLFNSLSVEEKKRIYEVDLNYSQLKQNADILEAVFRHERGVEDILSTGNSIIHPAGLYYCPEENTPVVNINTIHASRNFVDFMNIPLIFGNIPDDLYGFIIDEAFQRKLIEDGNTTVTFDIFNYSIVGVVKDIAARSYKNEDYWSIAPVTEKKYLYVKSYPGYEKETLQLIQQSVREWLPETIPYEIRSLEQVIKESQQGEKLLSYALLCIGILCLFITALGIYSTLTNDTRLRQKEVAIRKINGAVLTDIIWLFGKQYFPLFFIAILFAIPIAWMFAGIITQDYIVSFNYNNPLFWILITLPVFIIISLIINYKLLKIATRDPIESIRTE